MYDFSVFVHFVATDPQRSLCEIMCFFFLSVVKFSCFRKAQLKESNALYLCEAVLSKHFENIHHYS